MALYPRRLSSPRNTRYFILSIGAARDIFVMEHTGMPF
jgi:hypothetical protein